MATTLQTNDCEEANNPNTDNCKVLPTSQGHGVQEELQSLSTEPPLMSQSILLKASGLCKCTVQFFRKSAKQNNKQQMCT